MPNTPNFAWNQPTIGADLDVWGDELNAQSNAIDAEMFLKANKANPVFTGAITAPAFIGNPNAVLRPTVDGVNAIQFQNQSGGVFAWMDTVAQKLRVPIIVGGPSVQLRPETDGTAAILFQNAAGTVAAAVDTVNNRLIAGTGGVRSPIFSGDPVILQPVTDSSASIQFRNSAGTILATVDTIINTFSISAIVCPLLLGNPNMIFRPTGGGTTFQFQNAAAAVIASIDTSVQAMSIPAMICPLYTGASVAIRATTDAAAAIQFQNAAGTSIVGIDTHIAKVNISGAAQVSADLTRQLLLTSLSDPTGKQMRLGYDLSNNTAVVEGLLGGSGVFLLLNPTGGNVGVGLNSPAMHLHISGAGAVEIGAFTPSVNLHNSVLITDAAGAGYTGGALVLGSGVSNFAAIRASFRDGTGNGAGTLVFYVRTSTASLALAEVMELTNTGTVRLNTLPSSSPGAGSRALWYDPADGNRIKFAA